MTRCIDRVDGGKLPTSPRHFYNMFVHVLIEKEKWLQHNIHLFNYGIAADD